MVLGLLLKALDTCSRPSHTVCMGLSAPPHVVNVDYMELNLVEFHMSDKQAIALPTLMPIADLNKAIDSANKRAANLMGDYQAVGIQALLHLEAHGDVGAINRIIAGMPKGTKMNSMASWALAHGALEVNKDAATKKSMPLRYSKSKKTNAQAAAEDPWFNHLPEKAIDEVFDLSKALAMVIAKAKAEGIKQVKVNGHMLTAEDAAEKIKALEAFAAVK